MNFNERQLEAINARDGMYAVMAAAGSGKTAVLVERTKRLIADGANPKHILIITFSNEAKENLIARLPGANVVIRTFHGLAFNIIRKFNSEVKLWEQSWEKEKCVADTLKRLMIYDTEIDYSSIYKWISYQRFNLLEPDDAVELGDEPYSLPTMKTIYKDYIEHKAKNNLIEFDDMVFLSVKYFREHPEILKKYQSVIEYCMVDEFQDTSTDQIVLLQQLTGKNKNLMVVGDPLQNIYKFRGSDSKYLVQFDKYFGGNVKYINLNINYRSSKKIVEMSNVIAKHDGSSGTEVYEEAVTPNDVGFNPLLIDNSDTIEYIKGYIKDGYNYKDMFMIARTNSELQDFEGMLSAHDIPYKTYNNKSFLDNPEIKLVLSYLLLADDLYDNDSFIYLMNKPNRFIKKDTPNLIKNKSLYLGFMDLAKSNWKFKRAASELRDVIGGLRARSFESVADMIKFVRAYVDIDNFVRKTETDTDNRIENINKFQKTCESFLSIDQLKVFMNKIRTNNKKSTKDKVHLLTAHKSKGMESKIVFVAGMNKESFPHKNATDIESEYRLFYVACTRAEQHLLLMANMNDELSQFITPDLKLEDRTVGDEAC